MVVTRKAVTLEEFLQWPERKPALEYADGVVTQKVSPKGRHSRLQNKFCAWFDSWAEPRGLASAFPELRTTYAGRSYVPDVAVYLWKRTTWGPGEEPPDEFFVPPDVAVEIRSPGQSLPATIRKCRWYVAHGVPLVLLVDPDDYTVRVFRPVSEPQLAYGPDVVDFAPVLPGLQITAADLFAMLRRGPSTQ